MNEHLVATKSYNHDKMSSSSRCDSPVRFRDRTGKVSRELKAKAKTTKVTHGDQLDIISSLSNYADAETNAKVKRCRRRQSRGRRTRRRLVLLSLSWDHIRESNNPKRNHLKIYDKLESDTEKLDSLKSNPKARNVIEWSSASGGRVGCMRRKKRFSDRTNGATKNENDATKLSHCEEQSSIDKTIEQSDYLRINKQQNKNINELNFRGPKSKSYHHRPDCIVRSWTNSEILTSDCSYFINQVKSEKELQQQLAKVIYDIEDNKRNSMNSSRDEVEQKRQRLTLYNSQRQDEQSLTLILPELLARPNKISHSSSLPNLKSLSTTDRDTLADIETTKPFSSSSVRAALSNSDPNKVSDYHLELVNCALGANNKKISQQQSREELKLARDCWLLDGEQIQFAINQLDSTKKQMAHVKLCHPKPNKVGPKRSMANHHAVSLYPKQSTWQSDLTAGHFTSSSLIHDHNDKHSKPDNIGREGPSMSERLDEIRERRAAKNKQNRPIELEANTQTNCSEDQKQCKFLKATADKSRQKEKQNEKRRSIPRLGKSSNLKEAQTTQALQSQSLDSISLSEPVVLSLPDLKPQSDQLVELKDNARNDKPVEVFGDIKSEIREVMTNSRNSYKFDCENKVKESIVSKVKRSKFDYWPLNSSNFCFSTGTTTTTTTTLTATNELSASSYSTDLSKSAISKLSTFSLRATKSMMTTTGRAKKNDANNLRFKRQQYLSALRRLKCFLGRNLISLLIGAYILISLTAIIALSVLRFTENHQKYNQNRQESANLNNGQLYMNQSQMSGGYETPTNDNSNAESLDGTELDVDNWTAATTSIKANSMNYSAPESRVNTKINEETLSSSTRPSNLNFNAPSELITTTTIATTSIQSTASARRKLEPQQQQEISKRKRLLARINQMQAEVKAREIENYKELWRVVHNRQCVPLKIPFCSRSLSSMLPERATINENFMASLPDEQIMSYDKTLVPNQFTSARQSQVEMVLQKYEPLVDVRCYSLMPLFLCSIFVPKCIQINATIWRQNQQIEWRTGQTRQTSASAFSNDEIEPDSGSFDPHYAPDIETAANFLDHLFPSRQRLAVNQTTKRGMIARLVPPCRSVCREAMLKCTFFLKVLSLRLMSLEDCDNLPESSDENVCVGQRENLLLQAAIKYQKCRKEEFRCNNGDCIPEKWRCDGFSDCSDKSDEEGCNKCAKMSHFYCGNDVCISTLKVCDGRIDCRDGRDERLCLRLASNDSSSLSSATLRKRPHLRRLEAWNATMSSWVPVCGSHWQPMPMSHEACQALGFSRANETLILLDSATNLTGATGTSADSQQLNLSSASGRLIRSPPMLDHSVTYEQRHDSSESDRGHPRPVDDESSLVQQNMDDTLGELDETIDELKRVVEPIERIKPIASLKSLSNLLNLGASFGCQPVPEDQLISTVHLSCNGFQCGRPVTSHLTRLNLQQQLSSFAGPPMVSSVAIASSSSSAGSQMSATRSLMSGLKERQLLYNRQNRQTLNNLTIALEKNKSHFELDGPLYNGAAGLAESSDEEGEEEVVDIDDSPSNEGALYSDTTKSNRNNEDDYDNYNDADNQEAKFKTLLLPTSRAVVTSVRKRPNSKGTPVSSRLVVGGIESMPGEFPYLAALHGGPDEVFFCGGVLISSNWLVTAAHCVGNRTQPEGWMVKVGVTRRIASPAFVKKLKVKQIIKHQAFNIGAHLNNDIALIQLAENVEFNQYLRPICLPSANIKLGPENSKDCVVVGFGKSRFSQDANYLHVAHFARVPVIHKQQCSNWYAEQGVKLSDGMLCAGYSEGKRDACQGDSGSGLFCRYSNTNQFYVAGVVSFGIKCATPKLPGVYTSVIYYADWINKTISDSSSAA